MRTGLTEASLRRLYVDLRKTDSEIANFFGTDRTAIVHLRKRYGIHTRKTTGEIGEEMVEKELRSRGYSVKNMNEEDKLHPFDLLLEGNLRIEVKSAVLGKHGYFPFALSEKSANDNIESDIRIRLKNGRTRKLFRKTCDVIVFVGLEPNGDCHFFIYDSNDIKDHSQMLNMPLDPFSKSHHNNHREDWDLIKEKSLVLQH
ncbi:hypothetical protein [Bacillus sp. FJAT-49736]|uniref:hypothetical protein n=1 Tax=Bacillus sp. FJAT-49736 TaxID=2833582 RepID=UPI001BC97673|nr:hypothetical protein [Bacillus sp. FJAT-49736]MBS4173498.1 hypothetical protein [Bacillus sp. FJAT-49736]